MQIEIINAELEIDTIWADTSKIEDIGVKQSYVKEINDSIKINLLRDNVKRRNMYWMPGKTSLLDWSYAQKEKVFGDKSNLLGFDFFKGGFFEFVNKRSHNQSSSMYVERFDWRKRHNANMEWSPYFDGDYLYHSGWVTPVKDQGQCLTCSIFYTVGAVEARLNLYYNTHDKNNPHHLDVNISEQAIRNCPSLLMDCSVGNLPTNSYERLKSFRCQEGDYPYNPGGDICQKPSNCSNQVKIESKYHIGCVPYNEDFFKSKFLKYGPLTVTINDFPITPNNSAPHSVAVVGYETVHDGQVLYHAKNPSEFDIIVESGSPIVGTSIYWFKNSWGYNPSPGGSTVWGEDGYGCMGYNTFAYADFAGGKVFMEGKNEDPNSAGTSIQCSDEDGDGYYWWGISQTTPCASCPLGIDPNEDCDDSNRDLGPYDATYTCTNNCEFIETPDTASTSTLANQGHQKSSIIIPSGVTLTISATLYMAPGRKIIVKKGGKLVLTPTGKITSACNQLWAGIEVEGEDISQGPSNQGYIVLQNGSVIENAICGIKTVLASSISTGSGGIIQATGANFVNNRTSVKLMKYTKELTMTNFTNCSFKTMEYLTDGTIPSEFLWLDFQGNVPNLSIKGCSFEKTSQAFCAIGIKAYRSRFSLMDNGLTHNTFLNLQRGVYATGDNTTSLSIENCTFTNNMSGIYLSAILAPRIKNNTLDVALVAGLYYDNYGQVIAYPVPYSYTTYGIYLDASSGYLVEGNNLSCTQYAPGNSFSADPVGIYIRNSGPTANQIFKNHFFSLNSGISAYGINRNGQNEGLDLKCNSFSNCITDIGVYRGSMPLTANIGIRHDQGIYNTTDPALSAGNVFSALSFQPHLHDIDNANCMPIRYNNHSTFSIPNNLRMIPLPALSPSVEIHENSLSNYNSATSCPPSVGGVGGGGWAQVPDSLFGLAEGIETTLGQRVDGGSTPNTAADVLNSPPGETYAVYTDLLDKSPYLSDTVMKNAVVREDLLPGAMLRDILVANPQSAKSDTVLTALDNRFSLLNDTLMGDIMANETLLGEKELLEIHRAGALQQYGLAIDQRLSVILADTALANATDSLIAVYTMSNRLYDKYALALQYAHQGDAGLAAAILDDIPQQPGMEGYATWLQVVGRAATAGSNLAFDSMQVTTLAGLVASDSMFQYLPAVYARNCLVHNGLLNYHEPLGYDPGLKSTKVRKSYPKIQPPIPGSGYLKVFPNPAKDYIIVGYRLNKRCPDGLIRIFSCEGKNIRNVPVYSMNSEIILPVRDLPGSFLITLQGCSGLIDSQKIVVSQ